MTTPGEWIEWNGGECPVGRNGVVEIQLRRDTRQAAEDYHARFRPIDADHVRWTWNHEDDDVIAYRIIRP